MTVLRMKKEFSSLPFCLFFVCLLLSYHSSKAQSDSVTDGYTSDSLVTNEDSSLSNDDSENEYNELDTTGKYFNQKENDNDPYTTNQIKVRISSDSTVQKLRGEEEFWYVKSIEDFKKSKLRLRYDKQYRDSLTKEGLLPPDEQVFTQEPNSNAWFLQPWFSVAIWSVIILVFVGAIVYFLLSNKINIFSRSAARSVVEETQDEENLFRTNYDTLLQKYISEKNYRFAVRVLYLQLLKTLSEKELIIFQPQLTNTHYLQQLYNAPFYNRFLTVTRHYEYIWYGEFVISETSFEKVQNDFINLKNEISHR